MTKTFEWIKHDVNVQYVTIVYEKVTKLDFDAEEIYSDTISPWFDAYFAVNRRRLQDTYGISNMKSHVDFSDQVVTETSNTITYTQSLVYQGIAGAPLATEIVRLPFRDDAYRQSLLPLLQKNVPGFGSWNGKLAIPRIVPPHGPDNPAKGGETFFSPEVIAGISGGGALLIAAIFLACYCCCKAKKKRKMYSKSEEGPPDQFQFSEDDQEGISVLNEPSLVTKKTRLSADGSTLGYGDQRYVLLMFYCE
jgi:hypothetical protein